MVLASAHNEIGQMHWQHLIKKSNRTSRPWMDREGETIRIVDAHRSDGKRFIVRADKNLTAFMELESATRELRRRQPVELH